MGNMCSLCSCCKKDKKEYEDHLIREIRCYKCKVIYLSNYEYNKHIVNCNQAHGDM